MKYYITNINEMDKSSLEKLKYPVGKFLVPENYSPEGRLESRQSLRTLPAELKLATAGMDDNQLSEPYRDGGWSIKQIVHHLADSHMNSFIRFKLALTEENPIIKAYDQDAWAKGEDAKYPIDSSLSILEGVHSRLVTVLENMSPSDFDRTLYHPEWDKNLSLDFMTSLYGWHSRHHLSQITEMKKRKEW